MSPPTNALLAPLRAPPLPSPSPRPATPAVAPAPAAKGRESPQMSRRSRLGITLSLARDIDALEGEWRAFEKVADCTVFQSFDWLSRWCRHVGAAQGARAAVVVGRGAKNELAFLLPLAVTGSLVRRLTFLGDGLCDYNAPLLAPEFSARLDAAAARFLWREICALLQRDPHLHYDLVELTKMPEDVGAQANPLLHLPVSLNASGAHLTQLHGTWDAFYVAKRSSSTRRRDRTKLKRLSEHGEVRCVTPSTGDEIRQTLETLVAQKSKQFGRMGVKNLFARPGHGDFFLALATDPRARPLVHVSRLDVGQTAAAVNLGLTFRGTYYHVLASYDDGEVARFGPGAAHLRELLQHAIANGLQRFDFTIGDERYKLEWSDTSIKLYDHVAAATLRGWPVVMLSAAFRRLKRLIKQNPVLWRGFSGVRAMAAALRGRRAGDAQEAAETSA
ncbi:MAG: GNAT family N-acetyltransferase [Xanthobacteraceae bacterium]